MEKVPKYPLAASASIFLVASKSLSSLRINCWELHLMGQTHLDMRIHSGPRSVVVSALADTAATFTKVPKRVLDELGLDTS